MTGAHDDRRWMARAVELARLGVGRVEPNPPVGAVVVRKDRVLGEGAHRAYGGRHAEVNALRQAGAAAEGATLYVTLEPCSTTGKTPPCVDRVLDSGIRRVVVGVEDPYPSHRGTGLKRLAAAGIDVEVGVMRDEASTLLDSFRRYFESPLPFVIAKWAMSLDGKTATVTGDSRWISGIKSRRRAHRERREADAVLVGIETALLDDPSLTVRHVRGADRVRVVADTRLRLPREGKLVRTARQVPTWVLAAEDASAERAAHLEEAGCVVHRVPRSGRHLDLAVALRVLRSEGVRKVLLEGGGQLLASALEADLVDRVVVLMAPVLLGGTKARSPVAGAGRERVEAAWNLEGWTARPVGTDLMIQGWIRKARGG